MKKSTGRKVGFELEAEAGSKVFVAGTFNDWDSTKNPMKDNPEIGHYKAVIDLPPGRHEYKFVVNGEWRVDPKCDESVPNSCGSMNSVVCVS